MLYLSIFTGFFIVGSSKIYAMQFIPDEKFLGLVASLGGLFGAMRFTWSMAYDRFSFRKVYGSLLLCQIICCFSLPVILEYVESMRVKKVFYSLVVFICFWCEGGHFTLAPTVFKKLFGLRGGIRVWAVGYSFSGMASITLVFIDNFLLDKVGFKIVSQAIGCLSIVSLVLLVVFFKETRVMSDLS